MDNQRRILIVAYDDAQILDIACPSGALDIANRYGATPPYAIELGTLGRRAARSSAGIVLGAGRGLEAVTGRLDTLIVVGGAGYEDAAADGRLLAQVRRLAERSRRVASVCTGTYVLAAAGLLDHRRVTTHWGYGEQLAARHPAVAVDVGPLYIRDGNVYTSAGVTSALDLTLSLIEDDHGPTLARAVARELVSYLHRPADQAQISMFLAAPPPGDRLVRDLARLHRRPLGRGPDARGAGGPGGSEPPASDPPVHRASRHDPHPPFNSGNAADADPQLKELALRLLAESQV